MPRRRSRRGRAVRRDRSDAFARRGTRRAARGLRLPRRIGFLVVPSQGLVSSHRAYLGSTRVVPSLLIETVSVSPWKHVAVQIDSPVRSFSLTRVGPSPPGTSRQRTGWWSVRIAVRFQAARRSESRRCMRTGKILSARPDARLSVRNTGQSLDSLRSR